MFNKKLKEENKKLKKLYKEARGYGLAEKVMAVEEEYGVRFANAYAREMFKLVLKRKSVEEADIKVMKKFESKLK